MELYLKIVAAIWLSVQVTGLCIDLDKVAPPKGTRAARRHRGALISRVVSTTGILTVAGVLMLLCGCSAQAEAAEVEESAAPAVLVIQLPQEELAEENGRLPGDDRVAWEPLIDCVVTHYCACKECCGKDTDDPDYGITDSGAPVSEGVTIAVDPKVIPFGSEVDVNGAVYIAQDSGVSGNSVDIYIEDHERAEELGRYVTTVLWRPAA